MAKTLKAELSREVSRIMPLVMGFNQKQVVFDYDKEADVMYLSLKYPQQATDSELLPNDLIVNYRKNEIVGVTVLNAGKKYKLKHKNNL